VRTGGTGRVEGVDTQVLSLLSYTLRYINLVDLVILSDANVYMCHGERGAGGVGLGRLHLPCHGQGTQNRRKPSFQRL
jgi:hypothetical protein